MESFPTDEITASLLRKATDLKSQKDWSGALSALAEAKQRMLVSPINYEAETWCKYPLYLQQAGFFDKAIEEFNFLLNDLKGRARRYAQLDNRNVGPKEEKVSYYKGIIKNDKKVIKQKMKLSIQRESKRAGIPYQKQ